MTVNRQRCRYVLNRREEWPRSTRCHHVLQGISRETYNLEGMCHNAHSHKLLSVVATVHHQGVGQSLDDWACCLAKSFLGVAAGGVWDIDGRSDLDVVAVLRKVELAFTLC